MFPKILIFLLIFLASLFQICVFPVFLPAGVAIDLTLILVIFWSAKNDFKNVWGRIILAGFFTDLISFSTIGINILSFSLIAFGISSLAKRFLSAQKLWQFMAILIFVAIGTLANHLFLNALERIFFYFKNGTIIINALPIINRQMPEQLLGNILVFSGLFWSLSQTEKYLEKYARKIF